VSGVPINDGVEARGRSVVVRRLRSASVGHVRDDLPWDAYSADDLVRRWMADDQPEAWHLGARAQADAGDRFGADRMGDAASLPHGDVTFRSRATDRHGTHTCVLAQRRLAQLELHDPPDCGRLGPSNPLWLTKRPVLIPMPLACGGTPWRPALGEDRLRIGPQPVRPS
jgi:hypothetical protein